MSKFKTQSPIIHTPSFQEFKTTSVELGVQLTALGLVVPFGFLDYWYYYTDLEGWGKVLRDLTFKSNLYKPERFDCENYAFKAMTVCAERYGLNTLFVAKGHGLNTPSHAFNMFYDGHTFKLWEPNDGYKFSGGIFDFGEYNYEPEQVIL